MAVGASSCGYCANPAGRRQARPTKTDLRLKPKAVKRVRRSAIGAGSEIVGRRVVRATGGRALAVPDDHPTACLSPSLIHFSPYTMQRSVLVLTIGLVCIALCVASVELDDEEGGVDKRAMRNALVRFGRGGSMRNAIVRLGKRAMRNAIVRFGKRDGDDNADGVDMKRNAPQPFVRFGRSGRVEHVNNILDTLRKLNEANEY